MQGYPKTLSKSNPAYEANKTVGTPVLYGQEKGHNKTNNINAPTNSLSNSKSVLKPG